MTQESSYLRLASLLLGAEVSSSHAQDIPFPLYSSRLLVEFLDAMP